MTAPMILASGWKIAVVAALLTVAAAGTTVALDSSDGFTVSIETSGQGTVSGYGEYGGGDTATLTALASSGYVFDGWYFGDELVSTESEYSFTVTEDVSVTASFVRLFTIDAEPSGGEGTVSGGGVYRDGETATLTASAAAGYVFDGWYSGNGLLSSSATYSFTVSGDASIVAHFVQLFTVSIETSGDGTVSGNGVYKDGDTVTLTTQAASGYVFDGWYIGDQILSSENSCTFTISEDVDVVAFFVRLFTIGVETDDEMGTVSGGGEYRDGDTATIDAESAYGYVFDGWYIGDDLVSSDATYTFTVTEDLEVTAAFVPEVFTIGVTQEDDRGNIGGAGEYEYKTTASLQATAYWGYAFDGWYEGDYLLSTEGTFTFTVDRDHDITAVYSVVHDASFYVSLSSDSAPATVQVTPKYNVEIAERAITVTDVLSDTVKYTADGDAVSYGFYFSGYCALEITQTIVYTDGCTATCTDTVVVDGTETASYSWKYQEDAWYSFFLDSWNNRSASVELELSFAWYYEYLTDDIPRGYSAGMARLSDYVTCDDPVIVELASIIEDITSGFSDIERVNCVLKFVQSFEYESDLDEYGNHTDYYKYPAEMLWEQKGDCEDHAILFASLVKALGYDVVLYFVQTGSDSYHMAAGVAVEGGSGYSTEYNGKTYYYCEATSYVGTLSKNYRNVGDIPSGYTILMTFAVRSRGSGSRQRVGTS